MPERGLPQLALALAAAASSDPGLKEREPELRTAFVPAVAAMDAADRAYRQAIEATLPPESAQAMLAAMAEFRERVHEVRESARRDIGELYRRYQRSYGWLDPLDPLTVPPAGLSHVDDTRLATMCDKARAEVDALRARVNQTVAGRLAPAQIETLIAARLRRREAFEAALERSLAVAAAGADWVTPADREKAHYQLTQLADGWY
jgi:hypothetical protein